MTKCGSAILLTIQFQKCYTKRFSRVCRVGSESSRDKSSSEELVSLFAALARAEGEKQSFSYPL